MKDEAPPRSVGVQYTTGEEQRNSYRKNEEAEPKQKRHPVVVEDRIYFFPKYKALADPSTIENPLSLVSEIEKVNVLFYFVCLGSLSNKKNDFIAFLSLSFLLLSFVPLSHSFSSLIHQKYV